MKRKKLIGRLAALALFVGAAAPAFAARTSGRATARRARTTGGKCRPPGQTVDEPAAGRRGLK